MTDELKQQPTGEEPEQTQSESEKAEKTFTQSELDEIITKRIDRERKKYKDYEDLKTKITEYEKEREEKQRSEMTELARFKTDLEKEQAAKKTLESELTVLRESVTQERIRNAFITAATSANISYIEDAWALADKSGVSVEEDGKVAGIDEMITTLVESKPFLVTQSLTKSKTIGDPTPHPEDKVRTIEAQLEEAKKRKDFGKVIELSNKLKGFAK